MSPPTLAGGLPLTPGAVDKRPVFDPAAHKYALDGTPLPSVTSILGVLDKPALAWWGQGIGVAGVLHLVEAEGTDVLDLQADEIVRLLTKHRITVNHTRDKAGSRGSAAHHQLEDWAERGVPLHPADAPDDARGYIQSAAKFLVDVEPELLASEVMVWSPEHLFAGTFDGIARIDGELWLFDWKTSKRVYSTHHLQLAAYEGARRELGLEPIERAAVIHLKGDGEFDSAEQFVEVKATYQQFLDVKAAHDAMADLTATLKPKRRK